MKNLQFGLAILLCPMLSIAQVGPKPSNDFDSIFFQTYMETSTTDLNKALHIADSLYQTAKTDIYKVRSSMLISDLYHRKANRDSSIHYAIIADKIANSANIYEWQARISGVLSTQYRNMGLLNQGKIYLEKGLKASQKIQDQNKSNQFRGQVYQEMGYYALNSDNYSKAVEHFRAARAIFNDLSESKTRSLFLSQTEEQLGKSYLKLQKLDSAKYHYGRGLALASETANGKTVFKGFIYLGLGKIYLAQNKLEKTKKNLELALDISKTSGLPDFKADLYQCLAQYNKAIGDISKFTHYNEFYVNLVRKNALNNQQYADNVVTKTTQELHGIKNSRKVLLLITAIVIFLLMAFSVLYLRKQKKHTKKYQKLIIDLKAESQTGSSISENTTIPLPNENGIQDRIMPQETESHILEQLHNFEKGNLFLQSNLTLAQLAVHFEINTKYLSHTINKHKGKDFNNYINELRIMNIIEKIEKDPKYLNFKIGYLASECGFSSHSKFATVFKNVIGIPPSKYINLVQKEHNAKI